MFSSSYSTQDDRSIWKAFLSGDEHAFSYIFHQNINPLLHYGYKVCRDRELVEDKIQDLFTQLWSKREGLNETDSIRFYLFRCLRRRLAESVKADKLRYAVGLEMIDQFSGAFEVQLVELETKTERKQLVERLLAQLNDHQRDILHLKYSVGLSNTEIAEILGMEHQSVKNAVFRSISKIRRFLIKHNISLAYLTNSIT